MERLTLVIEQAALVVLVFAAKRLSTRQPLASLLRATARLERLCAPRFLAPLRAEVLARSERAARRASRLVGATCLPRALALRWWLRWAYGQEAVLVVGVRGLGEGFIGHAWLSVAQGNDAPRLLLTEPGEDHGTPIYEQRLLAGD